ncbi:MAG: DUF262 domain-containing protein [Lachnospiraceae bacterium]|nr:DUF262 domain-containing protein [Lachnospiraceae bacterium]
MEKMRKGERFVEHEEELDVKNQEDERIYPMNGIKIDKGFYTLFELNRRFNASPKRVILDSDFQREDVWHPEDKAELVESVLMGLPLPIFYFSQDKYGNLIVVDGRQRLTALFSYMNDGYKLKNLKILPNVNDRKFSELSPAQRARIEDFQIQAHVIMPPTPDRIKFDIFDRVNRGGTRLNKQEMRNALYQGAATRLLKTLSESDSFKDATGKAFVREKRMKDKYILTRYITFYLYRNHVLKDEKGEVYVYKDDIDELLGFGMDALNHMGEAELQRIEKLVLDGLKKSYFYLGEDGFRLSGGERRSPINMNVFETVMFIMQFLPFENESLKDQIKIKVQNLLGNEEFRENIGNHRDSAARLKWRLEQAEQAGRLFEGC